MAQNTAHVNPRQLHQLATQADGIDIPQKGKTNFCEACVKGKMHKLPHPPFKEIIMFNKETGTGTH